MVKIEVNMNLKKRWWNLNWTQILRKYSGISSEHRSEEIWSEYKPYEILKKYEVNINLKKFDDILSEYMS